MACGADKLPFTSQDVIAKPFTVNTTPHVLWRLRRVLFRDHGRWTLNTIAAACKRLDDGLKQCIHPGHSRPTWRPATVASACGSWTLRLWPSGPTGPTRLAPTPVKTRLDGFGKRALARTACVSAPSFKSFTYAKDQVGLSLASLDPKWRQTRFAI